MKIVKDKNATVQNLKSLQGVILLANGNFSLEDLKDHLLEVQRMINATSFVRIEVIEIQQSETRHFLCLHDRALSKEYFDALEVIGEVH